MTSHSETAIVPVESHTEPSAVVLWGTNDPRGMTARMTSVADAMKDAVEARGLAVMIQGRKYVLAEGWSLVGAMVGVFPRPRAVEELRTPEGEWFGFRATVDLVTRDGGVVGGAVALCTTSEAQWADRDPNQIASMAQTRATAKAYRQTLGFIMPMAGYAATPAEEMDGIGQARAQSRHAQPPPSADWWTRLNVLARERTVTIGQMSAIAIVRQGETAKDAITRWLNDNASSMEGDDGLLMLIDLAEAVPASAR